MQGDTFNPTGHLEVWKVYRDGTKELHWTDHNVITSGMGIGLAQLYSASGSDSILDYQILNFQVGTSGDTRNYGVSSYKLEGPLSGIRPYGIQTGLQVETFQPIQNGVVADEESFVRIPYSNIHKVSKTAVRYTLVLEERSGNATDELNEIGLFMRNPSGLSPASPILVAYRPFEGIKKTEYFTLVFLWTLQF